MTEQDKPKFAELMTGLAEVFGDAVSKPGLELRFRALQDYGIEQVEKACVGVIQSRVYRNMPTVAEIIEHIGGKLDDIAEVEAAKVWRAVSQVGGYQSVVFDDPTTQAVIEQGYGGWIKLCEDTQEDQQKWFLKDFARIYKAYKRQNVEQYGRLAGLFELQNGANGFDHRIPPPMLIGDQQKALAVAAENRKALDPGEADAEIGAGVRDVVIAVAGTMRANETINDPGSQK